MLASSQLDLVIGLDIHMEMVPTPAPVPTPFPMPFVGMIEFSASDLLISVGIAKVMSVFTGAPPSGPVLVNNFHATKTGDEAKNSKLLPHIVIPPGVEWTPLPKPLKLKVKPGPPPPPDNPAAPPGDAVLVTGSKTVKFEGTNACRLGSLAMSCSDPVRLPSSVLLPIPKGLPVLIGGPDALDWSAAANAFFLRNKWTAGLLHQLISLLPPGRFRNLLHWGACQLTGHPVDVATGRLLTRSIDFELSGPIPIKFERYYSSAWAERDSTLGYGWSHTFDERIWLERGAVVYRTGDGREIEFHTYDFPNGHMREGQELFYPIDRLALRCLGNARWEIRTPDGLVREFEHLGDFRRDASKGDTNAKVDMRISRLTKIRNRLGQWVSFEYYLHELDMVRTSEGRWFRLEHQHGKLQRVALPYPVGDESNWYNQVEFEYDDKGDLVKTTDSQRKTRTYQYVKHLMVEETDRDGVSFYFEYDGRDSTSRCIRTWGDDKKGTPRLFFREISYDLKNHRTFVEDSMGRVTIYEMNDANAVVKIIDPHGAATVTEYDDHLWKLSETDALGNVTRFEYDARGNETKRILANGAAYTMAYNASDQLVQMDDPMGLRWVWQYDFYGRLTEATDSTLRRIRLEYEGPYATRLWRPDGGLVQLKRDAFGAVTQITQPDGSIEERWYDRLGQLVKVREGGGAGRVWRMEYDLEGRLTSYMYPDGTQRALKYSSEGDMLVDSTPIERVEFTYRGYHQVASREVNRSGQQVRFVYDCEDRLVVVFNEVDEEYRYMLDACGRIKEEINFEGRKRSYVRDLLGNVTMEFQPGGRVVEYTYDIFENVTHAKYHDGEEECFTYDQVGRLKSATNASGAIHLERDQMGRVRVERCGNEWIQTTYDGMSQVRDVTSSRGLAQRAKHTAIGDLHALGIWEKGADNAFRQVWGMGISRDSSGLETGRGMSGGVSTSWRRDAMGRPTAQTIRAGGVVTDWTAYEWAGVGRLTRQRGPSSYIEYKHDDQGRLVASTRHGHDGTRTMQWRNPGLTGNIYRTKDCSDRRYGKGGTLLQAEAFTYAYDEAGNLKSKELPDGKMWKYAWSASGQLKSVEGPDGKKVEFEYDALGRRIRKTSEAGTTRWLWNGDVPVHEWREGEEVVGTTWVFEPDTFTPVAKLTSDGQRHSILTDYLGTPREMRDAAGKLAWKAQLDIYGVARVEEGEKEDCPWRWQGQYEDVETGLYYNRFRYYDPARGDYISQDPFRLLGGMQLYGYVPDPLAQVDAWGLFGSGKGPHTATANLFDSNGNLKATGTWQSGHMTPAEAALGFPKSTLATHTEARITTDLRGKATAGDHLIISGQYAPCNSCKGKMNAFSKETGAKVTYTWTENGEVKSWEANEKSQKTSCQG